MGWMRVVLGRSAAGGIVISNDGNSYILITSHITIFNKIYCFGQTKRCRANKLSRICDIKKVVVL